MAITLARPEIPMLKWPLKVVSCLPDGKFVRLKSALAGIGKVTAASDRSALVHIADRVMPDAIVFDPRYAFGPDAQSEGDATVPGRMHVPLLAWWDEGSLVAPSHIARRRVRWPAATQGAVYYTPNLLDSDPGATSNDRWFGTLLANGQGTTGQVFRRNRYFDPASGQFTQEDPIGVGGGMNLWGLGGGDPVNYSDPFGLWPCPELCVAGVGGSAVAIGGPLFGGLTAASITAVGAPIALAGGLAVWATQTVNPIATGRQIPGALVGSDATAVAMPTTMEMGKLGNRIRGILTGILIGKGGGLSREQEVIRRGGAEPAVEKKAPLPEKPKDPEAPEYPSSDTAPLDQDIS